MPSLLSLSESILVDINSRRSQCLLVGLNERTYEMEERFAFQYFPATVDSSREVNYSDISVPGSSLPIPQWVSSGAHTISFQAYFSADIDIGAPGKEARADQIHSNLRSSGNEAQNQDIRTAIMYLSSFMSPRYGVVGGVGGRPLTYPPRKCMLVMKNSGIGTRAGIYPGDGEIDPDVIVCTMRTCDVSYQAFFPSGIPRLATVSLVFNQAPDVNGKIRFPQSATVLADMAAYGLEAGAGVEAVVGDFGRGVASTNATNTSANRINGMLGDGPRRMRSAKGVRFQPYTIKERE